MPKFRVCLFSVYSPDMPKRLPIKDIVSGLLASVGKAVRYWFHYTLVTFAWLGVVPLTACKYLLSFQPRVIVMPCFVYKVIRTYN